MNPLFQESRDVALSILQPSARELERGLELHESSLVVDAYGFAPRAAIDTKALEAMQEQGATPAELEMLRHEMMMTGVARGPREKRHFAEAFETAGVDCLFQNAGEEGNEIEVLLRRLSRYTSVIDMMPDVLRRAVVAEDVVSARAENKRTLYLSTNGVPLPRSFRSVEEGVSFIQTFAQLGVKMMHLTYNRRNLIGDGCGEAQDGGLSDFGIAVVKEMNRCGVIVDAAHSSNQTGIDAARVSSKPVVISHATCRAKSTHCRSKTDAAIRAVAESGGYIGVCCLSAFLQGSGDIAAFLDHIDYAVRLVGAAHVAIGTDTMALCHASQIEEMTVASGLPGRAPLESLWMEGDEYFSPHWHQRHMWQSLAWTNWPLFTVGLVQRGYSDEDIQKIIGVNALRVMRAVAVGG